MLSVLRRTPRRRTTYAVVATLVVLLPLGWLWRASLVPGTYSVMDMGYADFGGGPVAGAMQQGHPDMPGMAPGRSVATLTGPAGRVPDVNLTLVARKQRFRLASGQPVDGYTFNGSSPGPAIHAVHGQLVQVRLVNESVPDGVTLHWHGVDVPNAEDGVAGVTQDAVPKGGSFTYRFMADQVGTFWYHSHQVSHEQVLRGLLGALVITAKVEGAVAGPPVRDELALIHLYGGLRTVNGRPATRRCSRHPDLGSGSGSSTRTTAR